MPLMNVVLLVLVTHAAFIVYGTPGVVGVLVAPSKEVAFYLCGLHNAAMLFVMTRSLRQREHVVVMSGRTLKTWPVHLVASACALAVVLYSASVDSRG